MPDNNLFCLDFRTYEAYREIHGPNALGTFWGPDGMVVVKHEDADAVVVVALDTLEERVISKAAFNDYRWLMLDESVLYIGDDAAVEAYNKAMAQLLAAMKHCVYGHPKPVRQTYHPLLTARREDVTGRLAHLLAENAQPTPE